MPSSPPPPPLLRLAVVAACAAGLAATRRHAPVIFERAPAVGVTWLYAAPARALLRLSSPSSLPIAPAAPDERPVAPDVPDPMPSSHLQPSSPSSGPTGTNRAAALHAPRRCRLRPPRPPPPPCPPSTTPAAMNRAAAAAGSDQDCIFAVSVVILSFLGIRFSDPREFSVKNNRWVFVWTPVFKVLSFIPSLMLSHCDLMFVSAKCCHRYVVFPGMHLLNSGFCLINRWMGGSVGHAEFKFLKRLILVHGRYSYNRTAFLPQYSFYKSLLICFIQILFSFVSGIAGINLFNSVSSMTYNVFYTSIPVLTTVLDKDLSEKTVMQNPEILLYCQAGRRLNPSTFAGWFGRSLYHPEDWDDEEDGEWTASTIPNPEYNGPWTQKA